MLIITFKIYYDLVLES